ncbi:hypothetical protein ACMCNP_04735 [Candidatus Acidulodesulfobacterium sp. H_13]|uniref:hypothetical protein n=1 Tax=Candidatus Acidulodesulfobacterium sp. H_13 TaxID=3395470 RepID=UPI003AF56FBD
MNLYAEKRIKFLFIIDYKIDRPIVLKLSELNRSNGFYIKYSIDGAKNYNKDSIGSLKIPTTPSTKKSLIFKNILFHLRFIKKRSTML